MRFHFLALAAGLCASMPAHAQTVVDNAWIRGTVPGQTSTGAFMQLNSARGARLLEARSPAAGAVEIHAMTTENNIMKMRRVAALDLPAGTPVQLKPGGYHMMLIDLKAQIREGERVPMTLLLEGRDGKRERIELSIPARALSGANPGGGDNVHKH